MDTQQIIDAIIALEWKMLISVTALDDPFGCREDPVTFQIMRRAQHLIWSVDTLEGYLADLKTAEGQRVNMIAERYAHMMKVTHPDEYEQLKAKLRPVAPEAYTLVERLMEVFSVYGNQVDKAFPCVRASGRPSTEDGSWTSVETYLQGELLTYSVNTLRLCSRDALLARDKGINLSELNLRYIAAFYGFSSLEEMERKISEPA